MDTSILVEALIDEGKDLLKYLFEYKWKINAAFWNEDKESQEWKLYLSIPLLSQEGSRSIYFRLTNRIKEIEPAINIDVDDIKLISTKSEIAKRIKSFTSQEGLNSSYTKSLYVADDSKISGQAICYNLNKIKKYSTNKNRKRGLDGGNMNFRMAP